MEQLVARQAHNLEVVRSSRAPATKLNYELSFGNSFFYLHLSGTSEKSIIFATKARVSPQPHNGPLLQQYKLFCETKFQSEQAELLFRSAPMGGTESQTYKLKNSKT